MSREHEDGILIRLRDALFPLDFANGWRVLTETLPLIARSSTCPLLGKEMPLVGIEKALSDSARRPLPSRQTLRFLASFSVVVIMSCSSVAIIQPKAAFQLGDVCFRRKLSIAGNLPILGLSLIAVCGRLLLRESRFHVDRAGASFSELPRFCFLTTLTSLKTNFI